MDRQLLQFLVQMTASLLLVSCASPSSSPQAIQRLDPAQLAALEAAHRTVPLSLDDIVRKWRAGIGAAALVEEIRRTGTHLALTPADTQRLREQGVAPEVLAELSAAQERWARDQATAEKVRRDTARAAAEDRAEAERRRRAYASPYYDPLWPYGYAYPYGYPGRIGYGGYGGSGGFGWGVQIRR